MNPLSRPLRALVVATIAAGAVLGFAGSALAAQQTPESGDDRATAHDGNVVAADCPELFPGSSAVPEADLTFTGGDNQPGVTITGVPDGVEVVGVVVKGGPAYNVYEAAGLGELPWTDLHAPLVPSGAPAAVSHWFVCAVESTTTTTTTAPVTTTTDMPPTSSEGEQPSDTTSSDSEVAEDVSPAAEEQDLAETGFNGGWLVALGAMLLLGGGALLYTVRMRGARR